MNGHRLWRPLITLMLNLLFLSTFATGMPAAAPIPPMAMQVPPAVENYFQGWSPGALGLAITPDGKTAYISFEQEDTVLEVDLSTFTVIGSVDVSAAGNMLTSSAAVLTPDGKKLYVNNGGTRNVMVVNTEDKRVENVLPLRPVHAAAIAISQDGSKAYVPSDDGAMFIINVADDSYQRVWVPGVCFRAATPSPSNPDLVYAVGMDCSTPGILTPFFFVLNVFTQAIVRSSSLPDPVLLVENARVNRLVVNLNETRAYFGSFRFGADDKGVGNFNVFDLDSFQVLTSAPIENGVADFAVDEQVGKIYIIGFWSGGSAPREMSIHEWDILTNKVIRSIPVSSASDQRAIAIDPTDADYLYMTDGDSNLIREVRISTGEEIARVRFNEADIRPYAIIRYDNTGYIASNYSQRIYKLDLASGQLTGFFTVPFPHLAGWGFYQGKFYVGNGGDIVYALNPSNGAIVETYNIGTMMRPLVFTFFSDRMAAIDYETAMIAKRLLIFDARTMTLLKSIELPHEPHGDKVVVSPDGSKLYVGRGGMSIGGAAVITIFDGSTLEVRNTIEIPPGRTPTRGATSFVEGNFDETGRILYLIGHASVYKIDMDTDNLIGILDLIDAYESQGINGWSPTGLSGVVLSPSKDKLFITSLDAHSMFTYDLTESAWATQITNLRGYFNTDAISSPDGRYLYVVNQQSDSVTMVDLTSGDVERIIDLQAYLRKLYLPIVLKSVH